MEFFETVKRRRSVRVYLPETIPTEVIDKAVDAAFLAPNSSNMQTTKLYWVKQADKKQKLAEFCLGQSAAKSAAELFVFVAHPEVWKTNQKILLEQFKGNQKMQDYYGKLIPFLYGWTFLAPIKWLIFNGVGLFRPTPRRPYSCRDISEICIKSAALCSENFMLAMTAQGYDTCPMEGFDESRVKSLLGLSCRSRVVMVISAGKRTENGIWGDQFRLPKDMTFIKV